MTAAVEQSGNDAAEAGGAINSFADVRWTTAAAQKRPNGAGLAPLRQAEHYTHVP